MIGIAGLVLEIRKHNSTMYPKPTLEVIGVDGAGTVVRPPL